MSAVVVRNLAEETHRALKQRAKKHGHSTEAEIRQILDDAVQAKNSLKIGSELAKFGEEHLLMDIEILRDKSPVKPADFQ